MRLLFGGVRQFVVAQRHQPLGFLCGGYPHHAAAVAGQGHEHARTLRRVELGRDILVGAGMADVEGQRRLMQVAAPDVDAGGLAGQRLPSIRADHQARGQRLAAAGLDRNHRVLRIDRGGLIVIPRQAGKLGRARLQRRHQRPVVDVVAELVEADFLRRKPHLRRTDQPAGVVDQAHGLQCRGLIAAAPPDIQPFEQIGGGAEQRRGAIVGIGRAAGEQRGSSRRSPPAQSRPSNPPVRRR